MNLKGRDLLTVLDYTEEELRYIIDVAKKLKLMKKEGLEHKFLSGKNIVILFEKDRNLGGTGKHGGYLYTLKLTARKGSVNLAVNVIPCAKTHFGKIVASVGY